MSSTLQWRKRFERSMTLLVIAALLVSLLPVPVFATSNVPQPDQQTNQLPDGPTAPVPLPVPQWPEAGAVAPYTAETTSLPAPGVLAPGPLASVASAAETAITTAPALPELVLPEGPVEFTLGNTAGAASTTALPMTLQAADIGPGAVLTAQVQMLDKTRAEWLSPLGFAFALQLHDDSTANVGAASDQLPSASQALTLTVDYSRIPMAQVGDVAGRLALFRATGCGQASPDLAAGTVSDTTEAGAAFGVTCAQWEKLPTQNDYADQLLTATLPDVEIVAAVTEPSGSPTNDPVPTALTSPTATPTASAPANSAAIRLFLPRIAAPNGIQVPQATSDASRIAARLYLPTITRSQAPAPDADKADETPDTLIVLATSASGPGGDYSATPLNAVSDYQMDLFAGTFATSYPLAVPPAAAGAAPAVSLVYNSGVVEGQRSDRNNQPGFAGIGWELNTGAITRLFKACEPQTPGGSASGLCTAGEAYVLTLNGVSSRLVKQSSNLFRLQDDPAWQVQQLTTTVAAHPDQFKVYWSVTTPDGTRYRFGGEIEPETGADQNSVFFAGIGGAPFTYVWRWNLDRVEDTSGNVASYFYAVELNSFGSSYVRAGELSRIEYTKRSGQIVQPHARVLFNRELRCLDPTSTTGCDENADFYDAPQDLTCIGTCGHTAPTFWTEYRLDSVQPQVYDPSTGRWRTTAYYDLTYTPLSIESYNKKTALTAITQRPGGDYQRNAFSQIEAESYDELSGALTAADPAWNKRDYGHTPYMYGGWPTASPYLVYRGIDFGAGASQVLLRYISGVTNVYQELRGREQIIHEMYSPPLNKIHPISAKNPRYRDYIEAGKRVVPLYVR